MSIRLGTSHTPVLVISPKAQACHALRKRGGVHSGRGSLDTVMELANGQGEGGWRDARRDAIWEQRPWPGPGEADPREGRPSLVRVKVKLALTPEVEVKEK